jgi:hypothetical protein
MGETIPALQVGIGLVFVWSSLGKVRDPSAFAEGLADYQMLPRKLLYPASFTVIVVEALISAAHLAGWLLWLFLPLSLGFLASFIAVSWINLRSRRHARCMCFGVASGEVVSHRTLLRLGLLFAGEGLLFFHLPHSTWNALAALTPADLASITIMAVAGLGLLSWTLAIPDLMALSGTRSSTDSAAGKP